MTKKLLFLLVFFLSSILLYSQVTTSGMSGVIQSAEKTTLPGATVLVVHVPTGTQYGTVTDNNGLFRIPNMRVGGPYKMTISYVGYQTVVVDDINLTLGQTLSMNQTLKEASVDMKEVEIVAKMNDLIDGNRTGASTSVNPTEISTLPSINRSITDC